MGRLGGKLAGDRLCLIAQVGRGSGAPRPGAGMQRSAFAKSDLSVLLYQARSRNKPPATQTHETSTWSESHGGLGKIFCEESLWQSTASGTSCTTPR
jgi:hypothetical protein